MKKVFFEDQQVRIASIFENKGLHLGTDLRELSHSSKDLVRTVSLRCKSNVKVRLKYIIPPKRKAKK